MILTTPSTSSDSWINDSRHPTSVFNISEQLLGTGASAGSLNPQQVYCTGRRRRDHGRTPCVSSRRGASYAARTATYIRLQAFEDGRVGVRFVLGVPRIFEVGRHLRTRGQPCGKQQQRISWRARVLMKAMAAPYVVLVVVKGKDGQRNRHEHARNDEHNVLQSSNGTRRRTAPCVSSHHAGPPPARPRTRGRRRARPYQPHEGSALAGGAVPPQEGDEEDEDTNNNKRCRRRRPARHVRSLGVSRVERPSTPWPCSTYRQAGRR